jgi:hypothetical protein
MSKHLVHKLPDDKPLQNCTVIRAKNDRGTFIKADSVIYYTGVRNGNTLDLVDNRYWSTKQMRRIYAKLACVPIKEIEEAYRANVRKENVEADNDRLMDLRRSARKRGFKLVKIK